MTAEISTIRRQDVKLCTTPTSQEKESTTSTSTQNIMGVGEKKAYCLSYFNIRGRAEPIRMLFALAGVKYTDKRISQQEWEDLKPKTPFGQLPTLEISGGGMKTPYIMNQTHSILRYLAREFGLDGRTSLDKAKVDVIVETMRECIDPIADIFNEKNDNRKSEVLSEYCDKLLPRFLDYLTNNLKEEWFLDQVSLADVIIYVAFDNISMFIPEFLENKSCWKLREWRCRFESHPTISEWLAKRPKTPY